jgi:chromosome segregation ATPase
MQRAALAQELQSQKEENQRLRETLGQVAAAGAASKEVPNPLEQQASKRTDELLKANEALRQEIKRLKALRPERQPQKSWTRRLFSLRKNPSKG